MTKTVFSHTALTVLEKRYLLKDENGNTLETPEMMFHRVATAIGKTPEEVETFFQMMVSLDFIPNSPTLMNAGTELGMLSACFVIPVGDSIEEIFDGIKYAAMIHKSGGGVGYSFSKLRPSNDTVSSTSGVASGPISFMQVYDSATETIKQGGKRRGANMGILHVNHPDIEAFIRCKNDLTKLNNFNISVALTDDFMRAVEEDSSIPLVNPRTGEVHKNISAKELFSTIGENAHFSGEPGVIFIDAINRANPTPEFGDIEATNPCGEQPLLPYESCNLGSINLSNFVKDGKIDYERLTVVVKNAVRFLDRVIDVNKYPLPQIAVATHRTRKIGLGVMGWADMLIKLNIPYQSKRALNLAEDVMAFIKAQSLTASDHKNATHTTIAPTGTISIIAGCSSGIEPLFAVAFKRRILGGEEFTEIHPLLEQAVKPLLSHYKWGKFKEDILETGKLTSELVERYTLSEGINPSVFTIAHDISPEWHLKMQAAFQKSTDNAVSKTINLPSTATAKDIEKIYKQAWKLGLKGVTIYRDGSRQGQVLSTGKHTIPEIEPRERPDTTTGVVEFIKTGCDKMYVTVAHDERGLCETFIQGGKCGGCVASQIEAIGRLISLAFRSGIKPVHVIKQLVGIRCPNPIWHKGKQVLSCADAVAQVLSKLENVEIKPLDIIPMSCPDCGNTLVPESGCETCSSCGWSRCKG